MTEAEQTFLKEYIIHRDAIQKAVIWADQSGLPSAKEMAVKICEGLEALATLYREKMGQSPGFIDPVAVFTDVPGHAWPFRGTVHVTHGQNCCCTLCVQDRSFT